MTQSANPLSNSEPWFVADGYTETTVLVLEQFIDEIITTSQFKPNATC